MSITQIYTCDCCGHEQSTDEQMWSIGLGYTTQGYGIQDGQVRRQDWCRVCMVKHHLLGDETERVKCDAPVIAPTLEDMVREICRQEQS